jgi:hypothetical protein
VAIIDTIATVPSGKRSLLATGVSAFPSVSIGARSEVRINGVVHVNTRLRERIHGSDRLGRRG